MILTFLLRFFDVFSMRLRLPCLLLLFVLSVEKAHSQLHFNHLSTANGLSQNTNVFIHKDRQGFVWISTVDGLNRFDGQSVREYRPQAGNPRSLVGGNMQSPFFEDENGNLWFGTYGAINCYHPKTDDFTSFQVNINGAPFTESYYVIHRDPKGALWTRLDGQLYVISPPENDRTKPLVRLLGKFPGVAQMILPGEQGSIAGLWSFGYTDSLRCYRLEGDSALVQIPPVLPPGTPMPYAAVADNGGNAWLCTNQGLLYVDCQSGKIIDRIVDFEGVSVGAFRDLEHVNQSMAYVATERGLYVLDKIKRRLIQRFTHEPGKPSTLAANDNIFNLHIDRDSVLWVSIWTKGVDYAHLQKNKFRVTSSSQLLLPGETAFSSDAFLLDVNKDLWLGSNMGPLRVLRHEKEKPEQVRTPDGSDLKIKSMTQLRSGDVLMVGRKGKPRENGLFIYDLRSKLIQELRRPTDDFDIYDVLLLQSGEFIVSTEDALYVLELNGGYQPNWTKVSFSGLTEAPKGFGKLFQDSRNRIYVSDNVNYINVFSNQNGVFSWITRLSFFDEIHAFVETDSSLWISSRAMFGRIPTQEIQAGALVHTDTMLNRSVYGLLPDNNGNLWLSTNTGMMRYIIRSDSFRQYHLSDGLQGFEYNALAYHKTPDGRLWFGGVDGVNYFHPDSVQDIQTRAPVLLTGLKINDEPYASKTNISLLDTLDLPYDLNTLSFNFVVADYSDPQNTQHWYQMTRLDGHSPDHEWIKGQSTKGFARYANLAPGKYLFKIKGANADGVVNPDLRTVFIVIHPPFWQTWWFLGLCFMVGALAIYAGIKYYIREKLRLKNLQLREQGLQIEQQAALTKERNRIAGEMHDDLGGGLTSIRMLSERLTAKTDNPDMKNAVDKIADHAQGLVLRMSEIIWAMNSNFDTVDNLIAYIRRYSAEYLQEHQLRSVIHVPQNVPDLSISGEKRRNIYLAVKESLHNIVKHAQADRVNIDFEIENNQLVIRVRDNGRGINPDLLSQFGNGLSNMKKRLEDIGGSMMLVNDDGTEITFSIPL